MTSYSIFVDDGSTGPFTEVDPLLVNDIPALRSYTVNFDPLLTSKTFRIYLVAENVIGSVQSDIIKYTLAAVPDEPSNPPTLNLAQTRAN